MTDRTDGFETVLEDLEEIVEALEGEELDLEAALSLFERGVERLRQAAGLLSAARGRVEELVEGLSGELAVVEFDASIGEGDESRPSDAD